MEKIVFGFVILHYQVFDMTVQCVENLYSRFDMSDKFVVIVDNASPNGSGKKLEEKYSAESARNGVKVILSKKNLGFAKGNNIGYEFLRNNFDVDFIVIMNNDVFIYQDDFFDKTKEIYAAKKFHVLGPDIYNPNDGNHQNPISSLLNSQEAVKKHIFSLKKQFLRSMHPIYYSFRDSLHYWHISTRRKLGNIKRSILGQPQKPPVKKTTQKFTEAPRTEPLPISIDNCCLHGAFYIFSRNFIEARPYAFNPATFMYYEEFILLYECLKNNMLLTYSPEIKVHHLQEISTSARLNTISKRRQAIFYYKNARQSLNVLFKLMETDKYQANDINSIKNKQKC